MVETDDAFRESSETDGSISRWRLLATRSSKRMLGGTVTRENDARIKTYVRT